MIGPVELRENRCENCAYWSQVKTGAGECRRHAPVFTLHEDGYSLQEWPSTYDKDWCGDFSGRKRESGVGL